MKKILLLGSFALSTYFLVAQNIGIGTIAPQAKLDIKGNLRAGGANNFLFYDSLSGKFTWTNSYLYLPNAQYIIQHSASAEGLYYHNSQLEYRYSDGTPRFYTNWNNGNGYFYGNLGIGTTAPQFPLHFQAVTGDKISLWGDLAGSPFYGFAIQPFTLQIHTDGSFSDISFGYGSSSLYSETMRIKGTGDLVFGGNAGNSGQVLTSSGSGASPTWQDNKPSKYFFFQRAPGSPVSITTTFTSIPGTDGQTFTLNTTSNLIITVSVF
jgi:hypothetical protein